MIKQLIKSQNILPQISAPYTEVVELLDSDNITYKKMLVDAAKLKPLQAIIYSDNIRDYDQDSSEPIYVSNERDVVDGHHRLGSAINSNKPIKIILINLNTEDCIKQLTKMQHILEYKNKQEDEKDVDLIKSITEMSTENVGDKTNTITAYRKTPIKDNSTNGNFFDPKQQEGYNKYEIEFNNLFDTDDIGLIFNGETSPVEKLAKTWFPIVNFDKLSSEHSLDKNSLINKMIMQHAKEMGYDGIKYGDVLIHAFN